jgi:hypothetical protein
MIGKYKSLAILGVSVCCLAAQAPAYGLSPCWREIWPNSQAECGKSILVNGLERQVRWSKSDKCEVNNAAPVDKRLITDQGKYKNKPACQIR